MAIIANKKIGVSMVKKEVAILDLGSSKVTVLIAERGVNGTFNIKGTGEVEYAGYYEGEFLEPDKVKMAVGLAINNAETTARTRVTKLYVGVPGEFTTVVCREAVVNFAKRKKINEDDINQLFFVGNIYKNHPTHTVINNTPIYFTLDDSRRIIEPRGLYSSRLGGYVSYTLAETNFLDVIESVLNDLGIRESQYISSTLAESLFLFEPEIRDRYALLVDCGHISTSVMLVRGDGLLFQNSFSMGGGHITGDLSQCLKITFYQAESLKRKIVLSFLADDSDYYEIAGKDYMIPFSAKTANEIVSERIDLIASFILKCFSRCEYDFPEYIPVYLTGGGLCYIRGARDYLSKKLGRKVEIIAPPIPQLNRPHFSTSLGVLDIALDLENGLANTFLSN